MWSMLCKDLLFGQRDDGFTYESCVGLGEPIFFYLQFAWYSAGFTAVFVFYFGLYLSKSAFGGFLSVLSFFYNHAECSRVQWAPPLRETFGYPLILFEMLVVSITMDKNSELNYFQSALLSSDEEEQSSHAMKSKKSSHKIYSFGLILHASILSITTALALMFWQFSQFVLFTQFCIISFLYVCNELPENFMILFTFSQWIGIFTACFCMQFNDMLVSSLFNCWTTATFMMFLAFRFANLPKFVKNMFAILMVPMVTFVLRHSIFTEDDSHIFSLLKSKLTDFENFHTLIYTCSAEYNFLPLSILLNLSYSGLIPLVVIVLANIFYFWIKTAKGNKFFGDIDVPVIYNLMQLGIFCVMAVFFMRLKLFSNPHLCIIASLFASKYMPSFIRRWNVIWVLIVVLCMSYQGIQNIKSERSSTGTFTYPPMEDLLNYIQNNTPPESVYAGPMTMISAILVAMQRPVVLHPHYEHVKIRNRTKDVYTIFSRKSENEVYEKLSALHVNYVIIDYMWCYSTSKMGCLLTETWDKEDIKNRKNPSFCSRVYENSTGLVNFEEVYQNDAFSLLKVKNPKVKQNTACVERDESSSLNKTKNKTATEIL
ncbi:C-mannosyltransferase dpy-19 isoform X2 [Planococcus citri]|uniref:C-mannosyltransferase dpy-19 isoform X2 n=1 Tax=Planococcus citri TaxID=170843 RepID=UPI0031FA140E